MKLPEYPRPNYQVNPIYEVICQLRFPSILRIVEMPTHFQEKIRKDYFEYQRMSAVTAVQEGLPPEIRDLIKKDMGDNLSDVRHQFSSEDKNWHVGLSRNDISLVNTGTYTCFEDFEQRLLSILEAFHEIYQPVFYSRIGLRYKNLIARSFFDIPANIAWKDLIPAHVAPELHDECFQEKVVDFEKKVNIEEGHEKITITHILAKANGDFKGIQLIDEESYVIDIDAFTEEKTYEAISVVDKTKRFKHNVQRVFRHSISETLHQAIENKRS